MEVRTPNTETEWEAYYDLRFRLLRKPLNKERGSERNGGDQKGIHFALYHQNKLLGIARLDKSTDKISQTRFVTVEENCERKGYGRLIMRACENEARRNGYEKMILHARENAVPFYKSQGYDEVKKTHVLFGQIQHYLMEKNL
ncbi:MAG: putative GNAT family N-acyltransferase [Lentimonas sp.]|jgi:predicted GNAT family N-acyltransferase